jgi:alanine racemase
MPRPILATIHAQALAHNLLRAKTFAPGAKAWAVVKANAYGHGIERVYPGFAPHADGFALLDLAEAARVRALGWAGPVMLLEGFFQAADLPECARLGLQFTVHCEEQLRLLELYTNSATAKFDVYLKMNSGMNRLGFQPHEYQRAWERLRALTCINNITLMTHFSDADGDRGIAHQLALFDRYTDGLPGARSLSNSAATSNWPVAHGEWIRPGIMLYGSSAMGLTPSAAELGLQATMSLTTQIIAIQSMDTLSTAGLTVGYGTAYTAQPGARIAVVACGYADGYPRHAAVGATVQTPVVVCGVSTHVVGRVSMDMITVDVTHIAEAQVGSPVELWGAQQPIDAVAAAAGTVGYELMCALAQRVPTVVD